MTTPTTPTPSTTPYQVLSISPPPSATPTPTVATSIPLPSNGDFSTNNLTPTTTSPLSIRDSLTSNRPAPPSPDLRRVSAAASNTSTPSRSSLSSRPTSTALSRASSTSLTRKPSALRRSTSSAQQQQLQSQALTSGSTLAGASPRRPRSLIVKIRDFAFSTSDARHSGLGPDVPKANRPKKMNKRLVGGSVSSIASSSDGDGDDKSGDDGEDASWGGLKWGFGKFSWVPRKNLSDARGTQTGYAPDRTDFARNFGEEDDENDEWEDYEDAEEGVGELDNNDDYHGHNHDEDEDRGNPLLSDEPLYPGLYRAMYPFEPEGASEMALEEGQFVRVVGRGGGVGWAIVVRDPKGGECDVGGGGIHALVPESYLEAVKLDGAEAGE